MSQAPKALHIVLNGVTEDSRVLKCAWSLGNAGWDVTVFGASPHHHDDFMTIGYARVDRVNLKVVVTHDFIAKSLRRLRRYKRRVEVRLKIKRSVGIPNLARAVATLKPRALAMRPDVIHAHDYTALPVAGALLAELAKIGHSARLIYDAHEYVPGVAHLNAPLVKAYTASEVKYSAQSSAILSVSEGMSDLLIPHLQISSRPDLVANDPLVEGQEVSSRNLRTDCGIDAQVPLMVYAGAVAPQRGLATAVAALRELPDVHLVVIANPANATVKDLQEKNQDLSGRLHVAPYVPNAELVSYLSTATIGLIPILHKLNHEISLITKFGEYVQARLPILVSDVRTMSAEVRLLGNGEVHLAGDVVDFVAAAKKILENPKKYSAVYTDEILRERSWELQAEHLVSIYNRIADVNPEQRAHLPFVLTKPVRERQ